ncbi:MAG TPA: D-alanine--D-alanine ligase [Sphingobacteriaceae bacterium]
MKTTVALVTGGFTGESVISLKSADFVDTKLNRDLYDVYKIIITKESWYYIDDNALKHEVNKNDFTLNVKDKTIRFDVVFIMLHGSPGEDGRLQGYLDMLNIPYTSCDALTSAITMNKGYTKAVVADIEQLKIARSVQVFNNTPENAEAIRNKLALPLFIKPNNGGSSIGMSKVKNWEELPAALEKAFKEDTQVLVEEFISGREFSIGVYNGIDGISVLPATEVIPAKEFFDFEAKYTPGVTKEITPGRMTPDEKERVEDIVTAVYRKLNCRGMVRIDYFLQDGTSDFYFVEINTIPGQTAQSFIPQQVRAAGMREEEFYGGLIEKALESHAVRALDSLR